MSNRTHRTRRTWRCMADVGPVYTLGHLLWCPGCEQLHRLDTRLSETPQDYQPVWEWDANEDRPTFSPSLLVRGVQWPEGEKYRRTRHPGVPPGQEWICHSFIRAGQWQFLPDSTHLLAGQTVDLVPLPAWAAKE